ncbi:MAG: glycoside hydrolase family 2, partial [Planctomycetes bacterium]|nr:glycoside hydrolase family 2 [Planctomycetota bacterium]
MDSNCIESSYPAPKTHCSRVRLLTQLSEVSSVLLLFSVLCSLCMCSSVRADWQVSQGQLMTRWAKQVSPKKAHPEYPRPQMVRKNWLNLNGLWEYAIVPKGRQQPNQFDGQILVPFPVESALSGVMSPVGEENRLWYRRTFKIPKKWSNQRVLLHFGAVDWDTTVWVNGKKIDSHRGGYDPFTIDITDALNDSGTQEIVLSVWDPTNTSYQPRGKQVKKPGGIWYTAVTGIWQTVWAEPVPEAYIKSLKIVPDIDAETVRVTAVCSQATTDCSVEVESKDGWFKTMKGKGNAGEEIVLQIKKPRLWSPDSPFLYELKITLKNSKGKTVDAVSSYFGMRKISLDKDEEGITRLFRNNKPLFQYGPLDQGWWPDGLYTAPTDEALRYDID